MNPISTPEIAKALNCSRQAVLSRAKSEKWPARREGKNLAFIPSSLPEDVVRSLVNIGTDTTTAVATVTAFKQCRDRDRLVAQQRAALLSLYRQSGLSASSFVHAYNAGHVSASLLAALGKLSAATFYRWLDAWKESKIDGLVPQYFGRAKGQDLLSEFAKIYIEHFYLDPRRPSARYAWMKASEFLPDIPSYQTALRYLKSLPRPYVDARRLGRSKFEAANFAYIERDPELYLPMDQLVSDHHCFDVAVERDGNLFRPWITAVQDYRSGKIVGYCPTVYPSSLSIILAFYIAVKRFGAGKLIHIDNGQDYRSIILRGRDKRIVTINEEGIPESEMVHIAGAFSVFAEDVTYAMPYHGQSKGRTERFFGTLAGQFSKSISSYVGSNTVARPEDAQLFYRAVNKQAKRHDVITWDNFIHELARWIDWYNSSWRGQGKGMDGRTPDEVFAQLAPPARSVDDDALMLAFTRTEERVVFENGVRLDGISFYWDGMERYIGQRVFVRRHVFSKSEVLVSDIRGAVIGRATADYFKETGDLAADNARVRLQRKKVAELVRNSTKAMPRLDFLGTLPGNNEEDARLVVGGEPEISAPTAAPQSMNDGRSLAFIDLLSED